MSAELRKSTGSDIKRLQEMVKRLEEQNAQLKNTDNRRTPNKGEDNMVKVKLNLDDVPLLDLNAMGEEDEDTWLVNRKVFWSWPAFKVFSSAILYLLSAPSNSTSERSPFLILASSRCNLNDRRHFSYLKKLIIEAFNLCC